MDRFEKFSNKVNRIAARYHTSKLFRLVYRMECWIRLHLNQPFHFKWIGEDEGIPVCAQSIEIVHYVQNDLEHYARRVLTKKVLLEGARVNAVAEVAVERAGPFSTRTFLRPYWIGPQPT